MNLKDIVKERKTAGGVRVAWDEKGEVGFIINYCGKDVIARARKNSIIKTLNRKTHQIEETIDDEKFDYEIMKETLVGWWGLKVKHLKEILDPSRIEFDSSFDEFAENDVEFNEENRDLIIKNYNITFSRFISSVSLDIDTYMKYKEEALQKN